MRVASPPAADAATRSPEAGLSTAGYCVERLALPGYADWRGLFPGETATK